MELSRHGLVVEQAEHRAALEQVLVHDLRHVLGLDHAVKGALGVDDHDGAQSAQAEAAGADDLDLVFQTCGYDLRPKAAATLSLPDEVQPVPPQIMT